MTPQTVVADDFTIDLPGGKSATGTLEHFASAHALVLMSQDQPSPLVLTVTQTEAPAEHELLADGELLMRNWVETRGVASQLADAGLIELTGQSVSVGLFGLEALVARML